MMSRLPPKILALDFDGVICDGLIEYFQTTQRTYCQIWTVANVNKLDDLAVSFYRLRPVIETGWEMPILLRALVLGITEQEILRDWSRISHQIVDAEKLDKKAIAHQLDSVRDSWIASDLEGWFALHRFYPGILDKISLILSSQIRFYIVTTKEGRFVHQLLQQNGINLPKDSLFGKEVQRPKYETIRQILDSLSEDPKNLWFVEDRLEALKLVHQQPNLKSVKLFLADWGYNTQQMRDSIHNDPAIKLLSLSQFNQDLSQW